MLSGCMFTQWTDHAFIGSPQDPPTHYDRQWAGAVILPAAIAGDILTAPFQLVALLIVGDYGIYARPNPRRVIYQSDAGSDPAMRIAGVDAAGNVTELSLTPEQKTRLATRLQDGTFDVEGAARLASN
ncbi:MAG: hypothetical protein ABR587_08395 [Candidatus Binatia bacterium]